MNQATKIKNFLDLDFKRVENATIKPVNGLELRIFGEIWENSLLNLDAQLLSNADQPIEFLINSPGGSVFDGVAMASLIKRHKETTTATGLGFVASIASIILLAADRVRLNRDAFLMIHNASVGFTFGEAEELRKDADLLDLISNQLTDVYVSQIAKNNKLIEGDRDKTKKQIKKLMNAETWFTAAEAFELGLIDEVTDIEEELQPLTKEEVNGLLNKYGATAPKQFLNKIKMNSETENKEAQPTEAQENKNFWDTLKSFFKTNPEKIKEVQAEAQQETETETNNAIETAKSLLISEGFVVLSEEEAEETNSALAVEQIKAIENGEKFDVLQTEYDAIMAKLKEFEAEFNGPSGKNKLDNKEEEKAAEPKTDRETLLEKYTNKLKIKDSKFFANLTK
jgi:ATP-dependent protease ClpP protease subunit